jgi:hypothetical protein
LHLLPLVEAFAFGRARELDLRPVGIGQGRRRYDERSQGGE